MADFLGHLSRVSGDPIPILPEATEQTGSARRKLQGKTVSPRPHLSPQFTDEETEPQRGQVGQPECPWLWTRLVAAHMDGFERQAEDAVAFLLPFSHLLESPCQRFIPLGI